MRQLGLIAPASGIAYRYYSDVLNEVVQHRLGVEHTASFMAIGVRHSTGLIDDPEATSITTELKARTQDLLRAGRNAFLLGSMAWFHYYDDLIDGLPVCFFHPVDALEQEMHRRSASGVTSIAIVGPRPVAAAGPLLARLSRNGSRDVLIPSERVLDKLDQICDEVNRHTLRRSSARRDVLRIVTAARIRGSEAIVIAAAELAHLLELEDLAPDCYNLPRLHAVAAAEWTLAGDSN